jgi:hypothetical protein
MGFTREQAASGPNNERCTARRDDTGAIDQLVQVTKPGRQKGRGAHMESVRSSLKLVRSRLPACLRVRGHDPSFAPGEVDEMLQAHSA